MEGPSTFSPHFTPEEMQQKCNTHSIHASHPADMRDGHCKIEAINSKIPVNKGHHTNTCKIEATKANW